MFNEDYIRDKQLNIYLQSLEKPNEIQCDKCGCWVSYCFENEIDGEYICVECQK